MTKKQNVNITFDKSATPFIMKCLGLVPKRKYIYKKDGTRAVCSNCGTELTLDTIAGVMSNMSEDGTELGVVCTAATCVAMIIKRAANDRC